MTHSVPLSASRRYVLIKGGFRIRDDVDKNIPVVSYPVLFGKVAEDAVNCLEMTTVRCICYTCRNMGDRRTRSSLEQPPNWLKWLV